ncbi:MAG TPA: hypothetical protein DIC52_13835 [Candidatus Latescibacteria bacterium]|nr:hypothetical protein [Candidatus Latescibacterota bacterium]
MPPWGRPVIIIDRHIDSRKHDELTVEFQLVRLPVRDLFDSNDQRMCADGTVDLHGKFKSITSSIYCRERLSRRTAQRTQVRCDRRR